MINWIFHQETWEFALLSLSMFFYLVKNFRAFVSTKKLPSSDIKDFPELSSEFQDYTGVENYFLKFKDFPGFPGPA